MNAVQIENVVSATQPRSFLVGSVLCVWSSSQSNTSVSSIEDGIKSLKE